ncbi:unnamed protein product [Lepeophtheirus salmonis]|uniref:(salmon louse) hypothetical protein n=1 Tax=Lepeophtheirus salmonis TaxID=72036 RepID=A0A7R8D8Q4_LEPSM|nr:unnamed protein product [Lepeophtheirus salmonis]CAF3038141.1 unnamed protein product [Lepeophtheirus salmonis]
MEDKGELRDRGSIFKLMAEMKKKDSIEKTLNKEKIRRRLKDEIKDLQVEMGNINTTNESILLPLQDKNPIEFNLLKRKSGEEVVEALDYKVADLRKKENALKYESQKRTMRIEQLMKEYEKVTNLNFEKEKMEEIMEESSEGETIKKKYVTILDMLKKERLTFGNHLEALEGTLKKQEEEISKLKKTHHAAIITRDLARQNQHKIEISLIQEGKEREKRIIEYRKNN